MSRERPKYRRLLEGRCPACSAMQYAAGGFLNCSARCGFLIREDRAARFVRMMGTGRGQPGKAPGAGGGTMTT